MTTSIFTAGRRAGEFLVSEANGSLSRDVITIASGSGVLAAGTVLSRLTANGQYTAYDNVGTDGTQTAAAVLYDAVDATSAAVVAVAIVRQAEVNAAELTWAAGVDAAGITAGIADLATAGIIAR
jgi:hypothetical protein